MPVTSALSAVTTSRVLRGRKVGLFLPMLFPLIALGAYRMGGETWLAALAVGGPLLWLVALALMSDRPAHRSADRRGVLEPKAGLEDRVQALLDACRTEGRTTAAFVLEIDAPSELADRYGPLACDRVIDALAERLSAGVRGTDMLVRLGDWRIGVLLSPLQRLDVEAALQMAVRLQGHFKDPVRIDRAPVYVTASIGFCLAARAPAPDAAAFLEAADAALFEARRHGPGAIRAFSPDLNRNRKQRATLMEEAARALETGEICAWYQPQVCTDTGRISGLEALARWLHPVRGLIPPADFLPELESAGLTERLGEVILDQALRTLRGLDASGQAVPHMGVNFTAAELRNPKLVERLRWELDRFNLAPGRLAIEILEDVVARSADDMIVRNIAGLADLGCQIDLDDFGTGNASITSLRRFAVTRLKIDRSFVTRCDIDPEQQRMVTTILTMAERLGLETLAEGVETVGENALLAQLGCGHVQGFGISTPMPAEHLRDWIGAHEARVARAMVVTPLTDQARRRTE